MSPIPRPVAIAVAPNGGRRSKADHRQIPLTPAEIAETAAQCLEAGAAMIHLHVRKVDGTHLLDAGAYETVIAAVRRSVGERLIVQITSESVGLYSPAEQRRVVEAVKPEAVSLALKELVPEPGEEAAFAAFLAKLKEFGTIPQIILYSADDAARLADFQRRGLIPWSTVPVLYVLGRYTPGQTSEPADLMGFLQPEGRRFPHWSVCAFGRREAACVVTAALLGGHVRVGFENNLWLPDGRCASLNADLVSAVRQPLAALGCPIATAHDLRDDLYRLLG